MTLVRDYLGNILVCGSADMTRLIAAASATQLPLRGGVDPYGDTAYNSNQCAVVRRELTALEGEARLQDAVREVRLHLDLVDRRPHRYLVFNGD